MVNYALRQFSNGFQRVMIMITLTLAITLGFNSVNHASAIPIGPPCGLFLDFDDYVFVQSASVNIKISDTCESYQGKNISVVLSNPDRGIEETGKAIVTPEATFSSKTIIVSGRITETVIELPKNAKEYSFLVSVKDDNNEIRDQAVIFSRVDADIVQVSDILLPENVSAGTSLKVAATIRDGLGNPLPPIVTPYVALQRPECSSSTYLGIPLDFQMKRSIDPSRYEGQILVPPDFPSGLYKASIMVYLIPTKGYQEPSRILSNVNIGDGGIPVTTLFYNLEELNATIFSESKTGRDYVPGDDIVVRGQVMTDDCQPLGGIVITGDFYAHPTPLIRASSVSDSSGNFTIHFQTYPLLHTDPQYTIRLKGEYSNTTFTWVDNYVSLENVKKFSFEIDGKESRADVKANEEGNVISLTLDKDLKKLTVVVESQRNEQAQYTIAVPSELLSGDIIILKDGEEPLVLGNQSFAGYSGPEMDPVNDPRHSYSLSAWKGDSLMTVDFVNLAGGQTTLEITGTSVIPEFGTIILTVLAFSIVFVLITTNRLLRC